AIDAANDAPGSLPDASADASAIDAPPDAPFDAPPPSGPTTIAFTVASFDFGTLAIGQHISKTFTLFNVGSNPSTSLAVGLSGNDYTTTADSCNGTVLAAGQSCSITIDFQPSMFGTMFGTLTANGAKIALHGTGLTAGTITITPTTIDLAPQAM